MNEYLKVAEFLVYKQLEIFTREKMNYISHRGIQPYPEVTHFSWLLVDREELTISVQKCQK
jgi:hypothetical protein